ncbi:Sec8 exocyst complex component-specific domain-containing protein [Fomitopsis serialis]|uniref:Sec8 exocyst complex component-specific domain-containing protein n=1 Tax=Fomitopsis serialis TaxID=139415 RepID=UPI0020085AED|nr:Sec8 exocyst complex component-specific domain-containing protein [Neoantrodia serialis]KAH9937245.1 Sec8 exocyst complex component-specific domain-containing protein [Neoantrodia serialis]
MDAEYEREKAQEREAERARQQRLKDRVPGRKPTGKTKAGDIDAVLDEIRGEWEVCMNPDFNPVELALQLLDESSLGRDADSFRRTKDLLSNALKGSVDKYYQAFAGALPHHAALVSHLGTTQNHIREARTALQEAKDTLGSKRADLVQLWSRSQTVDEMMRILDQIERLRAVPDALESLISEKRLLEAAVLLVRSLKLINKQDMLDVGAVSDLRSYLVAQEAALREILVDELNSHLYLKSFWCESRWAIYTPGQQSFPKLDASDQGGSDMKDPSAASPISRSTPISKFLMDLTVRPNDPPYLIDEQNYRDSTSGAVLAASTSSGALGMSAAGSSTSLSGMLSGNMQAPPPQNPEADSFSYIETLLEALAVLGRLGSALDVVAQKLPQEIYSLVESTLDEVEERAEFGRRNSVITSGPGAGRLDSSLLLTGPGAISSMAMGTGIPGVSVAPGAYNPVLGPLAGRGPPLKAAALRLAALEASTKVTDQETLRDFFWTLYSKMDAVTQGLRVVYEVSNRIGSRRHFSDSSGAKPGSLFPLAEVWMPIQAEIRTLIGDYVTDEEQGTVSGRNPISSINEVLREGKFNRDKSKPVFRFADTDAKYSMKALKLHEDELTRVLRDTVPGLVQGSADSAVQATLSAVGTDDRLSGTSQHHRVLIRPDAFHVSILFQPTLAWLDRIADVLPSGLEAARSTSMVLEDFVLNVYLPQLEDKVSELFHQAVTSPDAFEPDPATNKLSPQPLAGVQVMALINSLCAMLRTTPFHRENYSRLILTVIGQFYQRCSDRFYDLVAVRNNMQPDAGPRIVLGAQWAQKADLGACLSELLKIVGEDSEAARKLQLCRQEAHLEQVLQGDETIIKQDLISSARNMASLASLYRTVVTAPESALSPTTPLRLEPVSAVTPYTPYLPAIAPVQANEPLSLPLSSAMAMRFQALHMTYAQLAELVMYTLRIDIRCRATHFIDLALRHGIYKVEREVSEPDPNVIDLNVELSKCDDWASSTLPERERRYMFEGLPHLMERLLISKARHIRALNAFGIKKMNRNMLALQQNIKTMTQNSNDLEFDRAKRYYSLFSMSPQDMLDSIRKKQEFSFDEYKVMLDLQCGVDPTNSEQSAAQATNRSYSLYVIDLHGLELQDGADGGSS